MARERTEKNIPANSFGGIIRAARLACGLDLFAAGRKAGFSSGDYWNLIEQGKRHPKLDHVPAIAEAVKLNGGILCLHWIEQFAPPAHEAILSYLGLKSLENL